MSNLILKTVKVGKNIKKALNELADFDADFNGENGLEYLWNDVWKENGYENEETYNNTYYKALEEDKKEPLLKYENNIDYLLSTLNGTDEEIVEQFIRQWMEHDSNYYDKFDYEVFADKNGKVKFIVLAITCDY